MNPYLLGQTLGSLIWLIIGFFLAGSLARSGTMRGLVFGLVLFGSCTALGSLQGTWISVFFLCVSVWLGGAGAIRTLKRRGATQEEANKALRWMVVVGITTIAIAAASYLIQGGAAAVSIDLPAGNPAAY